MIAVAIKHSKDSLTKLRGKDATYNGTKGQSPMSLPMSLRDEGMGTGAKKALSEYL